MFRTLCLMFVVLTAIPQVRADEDLSGTWKNTADFGVSFWELSRKDDGTYDAREYGLGNRTGIAKLMDGRLFIQFEADGHRGIYDWELKKGRVGQGTYMQISLDDGQIQINVKTSVRFIGK